MKARLALLVALLFPVPLSAGAREAFLAEFHRIVPPVRAGAGCLDYGPAIDVPSGLSVQPPVRENVMTVIERWESLEALRAHLAASHMQDYRARVKDYVVRTQIQVLQPA
jgi:quinol monooxygenase YgiN